MTDRISGCGIGIFTTPSWDIFHAFCVVHDQDYRLSAEKYAEGVIEGSAEKKELGLSMKILADEAFTESCRQRAEKSFILFRGITHAWAELYIGLVYKNSRDIWFFSVGQIIAEHEKENQPDVESRSTSTSPAVYGRDILRRECS